MKPTHILAFVLMFCCVNGVSLHARGTDESVCVKATESPLDPIFKYVESIANKAGLKTTSIPYKNIYAIIRSWKRGRTNITIETLVKMAYFLGTDPATLLKLEKVMTHSSAPINEEDIRQALESKEPLSLDMLKYLNSKKDLPRWYINYLERRIPLSNDLMVSILGHIQTEFKERILELQQQTSRLLGYDISLESLPQAIGISDHQKNGIISNIVVHDYLPNFNIFTGVLKASNTDAITFFEAVQADDEFQIPFRSARIGYEQNLNARQQEIMKAIGNRIQWAMNLRRFSSARSLVYLTGLNKTRLSYGERDIFFSSFVDASFATEIPLSVLMGSSKSLEDYVKKYPRSGRQQEDIHAERVSGNYITRFQQAFRHFIIWKMQKQNISLFQLARNSYLQIVTIRNLIINEGLPKYLNLLRLVQDGFGQDIVAFFQEFEMFVEALHNPPFEGSNPYFRFEQAIKNYELDQSMALREDLMDESVRSLIVEEALKLAYDRIIEVRDFLNLSNKTINRKTGVNLYQWDIDSFQARVTSFIRLAHFFGITLFQLLGLDPDSQPLSELIKPENFTSDKLDQYTPPSDEDVRWALNRLSTNIQEYRGYDISDRDLIIRLAIRLITALNPILHGKSTANVGRLFQMAEALAWTTSPAPPDAQTSVIHTPPSQEEFYETLKIILEGVGLPAS